MFFICKYRTVDVNVLKKAVIHFRCIMCIGVLFNLSTAVVRRRSFLLSTQVVHVVKTRLS